jgi:hypothetical protein
MKKNKNNQKSIIKYLVVLGLLILGGVFLFNSMKQSPQVAEIVAGETCTSNLASFEVTTACSSDGFSSYKYSCKNNSTVSELGTSSDCISFPVAIAKATALCGKTCIGQVTPPPIKTSPHPTFTPPPSTAPTSTPIAASARPTTSPRPSSSPQTSCASQLGSWRYTQVCRTTPTAYRYFSYQCFGDTGYITIGNNGVCKTEADWLSTGRALCQNRACVSPTPSPTASPVVKVFPTPNPRRCYKIFGKEYCYRTTR